MENPVTRLQQLADEGRDDEFAAAVDALELRWFVSLDERARSWFVWREHVPNGLLSRNGYERERAARKCRLTRGNAALLLIRTTDWVPQVRQAALKRLRRAPDALLVEMLPLADHLARSRQRTDELDTLLETHLAGAALRAAAHDHPDRTVRAAAWRRLIARGDLAGIERAARDASADVRAVAARTLPQLAGDERLATARLLVADRVGWIAARALDALVEIEGDAAIRPHLMGRSVTLRRRARDWAQARGIDPRPVYLTRLEEDPDDEAALIGLAEAAEAADVERIRRALRDRRSRVRAAALQAVARLDPPAARRAALVALHEGSARESRAAKAVLQGAALDAADRERLRAAALDPNRPWSARMRALALLRRSRWEHLGLLLRLHAKDPRPPLGHELDVWLQRSAHLTRGPGPAQRAEIEPYVAGLDADRRRLLELILRATD